MSVTVHDARRSRRQRWVVAATVLATMSAIVLPAVTAGFGPAGRKVVVDPSPVLTLAARRVLKEVPGAFETGGDVVVPASTDPDTRWGGALGPELIAGPVVPLGVHGLAEPGYLPTTEGRPAWRERIGTKDRVYDDVGAVSFACTRWPGLAGCTGSLLMEHAGRRYLFRSGLHLWQRPGVVTSLLVLDEGLPRDLVLGGAPPDTARVVVTLAGGGREVGAHTTAPGAVHGLTLWWVTVADPVAVVTFFDREGAATDHQTSRKIT